MRIPGPRQPCQNNDLANAIQLGRFSSNWGSGPPSKRAPLGNLGLSSESPIDDDWITKRGPKLYAKRDRHANLLKKARMIRFQRAYAMTDSIRYCGLHAIPLMGQSPSLNVNEKGYSWNGLQSCGNRSCINCAARAIGEKVNRIQKSVRGALVKQKLVLFVTLTTKRSNHLTGQIKELRKGWKAVQNRLDYDVRRAGGAYDTVRGLDVTFKPNWGNPYHLHMHCLIIIDLPAEFSMTGLDLCHRIKNAFSRKAWRSRIAAQDAKIVARDNGASDYVAKFAGLGFEIANPRDKTGRDKDALSLCQLIDQASETRDPRLIHIYQGYQTAMKGVKTLSFSKTWDRWQIEEEEEEAEESEPVLIISKPWWHYVQQQQHRLARLVWLDVNYNQGFLLADLNAIMRAPPDPLALKGWMHAAGCIHQDLNNKNAHVGYEKQE